MIRMIRSPLARPRLARLARAGLISTVLAAAATGLSALPARPAAAAQHTRNTQTTLRVWYASDDPTESPLAQALGRSFQQTHPGVTVLVSPYGLDDMNAKLQLALGSGNPPDLIYTTPRGPGLPIYLHDGKLLDLTAIARKDGWAGSLRPGLLAQYNDSITRTGNAGGHVFAAPYVLAAVGLLYNQTILTKLHVAVPRSLPQLEQDLATIKRAGLTPLGFGNADGWVGDDWYLTLVNSLTNPATLQPEQHLDPHFRFSGPAFTQAGQLLQQWAQAGYFTSQFAGLDAQDSVEAFFGGHTALQLVSSTQNGQIVADAAQTHTPIGIAAFPGSGGTPVMPQSGYEGWAIPAQGRQPALAEEFITQMLSAQTAQTLLAYGLLPARSNASASGAQAFQRAYLQALASATPGVYLDGAPVPNLNATMEANVELLLQRLATPGVLTRNLQLVYDSDGVRATSTRTDGEF